MSALAAARRTLEIARLVAAHRASPRPLSPQDHHLIDGWLGWGAVARLFDPHAPVEWTTLAVELETLLPPAWIEHARAATVTSYFTDRFLVEAIWSLATGLGFAGGQVLEPGCGSGLFLAAAPPDLPIRFTGIERDPFSATLATLRFPQARIYNEPLEEVVLAHDGMDLVIGNVPFADIPITDPETRTPLSLHNYFLWRAGQALRPGGLLLVLTSRYTLDARDQQARALLAEQLHLLGAFRLPSGAHRAAGTEVLTDLLILQKQEPGREPARATDWLESRPFLHPQVSLNQYYQAHPAHMLGTPVIGHGMYRADELLVQAPADLPGALAAALETFIARMQADGTLYRPPVDRTVIPADLVVRRADQKKEGSFHLDDDARLVQVVDGQLTPVTVCITELKMLVTLRDAVLALLDAERDLDRADEDLDGLRRDLNRCYDRYVRAYGPVNRATLSYRTRPQKTGKASGNAPLAETTDNHTEEEDDDDEAEAETFVVRRRPRALCLFAQDPDYSVVLGLEEYDDELPEGQRARKAEIFFQRVQKRPVRRTRAESPAEALSLCLDECGHVDLERIAGLLTIPVKQVPAAMGDLLYEDPRTDAWEPRSRYLAGNVRRKLEQARQAAAVDPRFQRNVTALETVLPPDVLPGEIKGILGAPWISPDDIARFCQDLVQIAVTVVSEPLTALWEIQPEQGSWTLSPANLSQWGTRRRDALTLIADGLNKRVPVVSDVSFDGSTVKNQPETVAAQEKLQGIQERFSAWLWEDDERASRLAAEYNRRFNSEVAEVFDGSFLTFPGMNPVWEARLYPWQRDFVARAIASRAALCAYPVGAGKTTIEVMVAMTLRRLGLINRAAIVVPNHLLEQIASEAQRLYPSARLLILSRNELSKERKRLFTARVAAGTYDLVVMTHAALFALGVHPETERAFLEERKTLYRQALREARREGQEKGARRTVKHLEKEIARMEARQRDLLRKPCEGITFEQLGISYLIVDEFHLYKNLGLPTRVPGFQVQASQRAADMELKLRWLERYTEGRPFAAAFTATPLSNNMVEAYVMAWYLDRAHLFAQGLRSVEAFVSTFIEIQTRVEISPDGSTFRQVTRPACFVNLPEFQTLIRHVMDIRPPSLLDAKRPRRRDHVVKVQPTPEVLAFVDTLVKRAELLHQGLHPLRHGVEDSMLLVTTDGRKVATWGPLAGVFASHEPKLEAVAANVLAVFRRNQQAMAALDGPYKSFQIVFCDLGTPSEEKGEQVYGALTHLLVAGGMPRRAIRYIHEARGDAAKAALFQQCRNGQVAVLIGSTEMLGVGTNIQTRCAALHHLDAPWRPDQVEQREGRCHRPGNRCAQVDIYYYVQERTFDSYVWQMLKNKARFFTQLSAGTIESREMAAQSETELTYGQVMAAATGNPLLLEKAEIEIRLGRLERLWEHHKRTCARNAQEARACRALADQQRAWIAHLAAFRATIEACAHPGFVTERGEWLSERQAIGTHFQTQVLRTLMQRSRRWWPVGAWSEIPLSVRTEGTPEQFEAEVLIGQEPSWETRVPIPPSWLGTGQHWRIVERLEQFLASLPEQIARAEQAVTRAEQDALAYDAQAQVPFASEEEYRSLLVRKLALQNYTALVAAGGNPEELEAQKAALLAEATIDLTPEEEAGAAEMGRLPAPELAVPATEEREPTPVAVQAELAEDTSELVSPVETLAEPEPEPVAVVEPVAQATSYAEVVAQVRRQMAHLSLDELLAVSLFGADLPEPEAQASTPKRRRRSARKQRAATPAVQLELVPSPLPTPLPPVPTGPVTLFDLLEQENERQAA